MNPLLAALVRAGIITQADADAIMLAVTEVDGGELPMLLGEFEITEQDIRRAMSTWDELMPDFRGLLDAEIVDDGEVD